MGALKSEYQPEPKKYKVEKKMVFYKMPFLKFSYFLHFGSVWFYSVGLFFQKSFSEPFGGLKVRVPARVQKFSKFQKWHFVEHHFLPFLKFSYFLHFGSVWFYSVGLFFRKSFSEPFGGLKVRVPARVQKISKFQKWHFVEHHFLPFLKFS